MFFSKSIKTVLVAVTIATAALAPASTVNAEQASLLPTEDLIGEELVTAANANAFADRIFAEAARILSSGSWLPIPNFSGVKNEFKDVSGVFASSGVLVTRAKATVNAPAQKLFDYLVTAEGYQLIDPFSKPEDFAKAPLEKFATDKWRPLSTGAKRLEAAHTVSASVPIIKEREFVVLNAIDAGSRTFVSKSIQHAGFPGCSKYGGAACYNATSERTRALNSFAVQVDPVAGNANQCVVQLVNYADFAGWEIPAVAMNVINFGFLPDMVGRMRAAFP